jgi:hypothetical protein
VSGVVNVPASAAKLEQASAVRSPVSRVTVRVGVSSPEPPVLSVPSAVANVTCGLVKYGADAPVSVIVCPDGAVPSAFSAMPSDAVFPALSVATMLWAPGSSAPAVQA